MKRARSPAPCPGVVLLALAFLPEVALTARAQAPEPVAGAVCPEIVEPAPLPGGKERPRFRLESNWEDGLRLRSDDDQFHVHVGGNAQPAAAPTAWRTLRPPSCAGHGCASTATSTTS